MLRRYNDPEVASSESSSTVTSIESITPCRAATQALRNSSTAAATAAITRRSLTPVYYPLPICLHARQLSVNLSQFRYRLHTRQLRVTIFIERRGLRAQVHH